MKIDLNTLLDLIDTETERSFEVILWEYNKGVVDTVRIVCKSSIIEVTRPHGSTYYNIEVTLRESGISGSFRSSGADISRLLGNVLVRRFR